MNQKSFSRRSFLQSSTKAVTGGVVGAALIGCGSDTSPTGRTPVQFLAILNPEGLTFAPELLGITGGYFADQGLDVTLQQTRGSAPAIQAVISGSAPLTRIEQIEGMIHLANTEVPLVNVGTVIKKSSIRFVSSARAPIREPRDFTGKLAGIPSAGGSTDMTLNLILSTAGIDPESVERQVVGPSAGTYDLIERGSIQCYGVSIDTANFLVSRRDNVVVLNPGDFMSSGSQFYTVSNDGLIEHRDTIRRYLAAVDAAIDFIINDDGFENTLATLRQEFSFATLEDSDIAKASLAEYVEIWTAEGRENVLRTVEQTWQQGYAELVQSGLAQGGFDPSSWYTNELSPA